LLSDEEVTEKELGISLEVRRLVRTAISLDTLVYFTRNLVRTRLSSIAFANEPYASMAKMKAVQPHMTALRERAIGRPCQAATGVDGGLQEREERPYSARSEAASALRRRERNPGTMDMLRRISLCSIRATDTEP
jgi:hypothetical protein